MDCNIATVQGGVCLQRCIKLPKSQIATILSHMAIQIARARLTWVTPYWHTLGLEKSSSAEYGRVCLLSIGNNQANLVADLCSEINVTLIVVRLNCAGAETEPFNLGVPLQR